MFSGPWPSLLTLAVKGLALASGVGAAVIGYVAARLWLKASGVSVPELTEPAPSMEDNPALHILNAYVQLCETKQAYDTSARLNATAARWTAWAAILTGAAAVLSAL